MPGAGDEDDGGFGGHGWLLMGGGSRGWVVVGKLECWTACGRERSFTLGRW